MAYSIMLDAGHGGQDPGAVYKGRQEKNDNLKLALAVGEILQSFRASIRIFMPGFGYRIRRLIIRCCKEKKMTLII